MGEFELIKQFFSPAITAPEVLLGVGDDAAVVAVPAGQRLVAAVDTLVAGVHFPDHAAAFDIGWRALAVNLSDMAAMGAVPRWFTLSLCIPDANPAWLKEFAAGLQAMATRFAVDLIGGDTVKGPLNISVQILGTVEPERWLQRSGAQAGDVVYVSGTPGDAAGGLRLILDSLPADCAASAQLLQRFWRPEPRVALGRGLRTIASAAMDVSDGLLVDLAKLCAASNVGAALHLEALPLSSALTTRFGAAQAQTLALSGGDDYELLFTVPAQHAGDVAGVATAAGVSCQAIGVITQASGVQCLRDGVPVPMDLRGYDHFND